MVCCVRWSLRGVIVIVVAIVIAIVIDIDVAIGDWCWLVVFGRLGAYKANNIA